MEPEVRIALSPPPAQATAHQAFRRLIGRNRVREAFCFSVRLRVSFQHPVPTAVWITTSNLRGIFVVVIFTGGRRPGRDNHGEWIRLLTPPAVSAILTLSVGGFELHPG